MGVFFSKKKPPSQITEQDKAVLRLKHIRDKIKQYQKRIEQDLEKDRQIAKKLLQNGRKDRALSLLRKKKFLEQVLSKNDSQLETLERMVHDLEFAQVETKVIEGLKIGNIALKKLQDILKIDEIEKVMDETREGVEKQQELDDLLSGVLTDEDEGEVEAELDALLAEELKETIPELSPEVSLPDVPEDEIAIMKEPAEKPTRERVALEA